MKTGPWHQCARKQSGRTVNPTGTLYSKEDMLALGEVARKHNLFLISDEVYREFSYTDEPRFSAMNIPGLADNVILVDSVLKRYNLCGCRVGCIVSHNKEVMSFMNASCDTRHDPPSDQNCPQRLSL